MYGSAGHAAHLDAQRCGRIKGITRQCFSKLTESRRRIEPDCGRIITKDMEANLSVSGFADDMLQHPPADRASAAGTAYSQAGKIDCIIVRTVCGERVEVLRAGVRKRCGERGTQLAELLRIDRCGGCLQHNGDTAHLAVQVCHTDVFAPEYAPPQQIRKCFRRDPFGGKSGRISSGSSMQDP